MEPDRRTITYLQAGRGAAALAVVFHHAALAARDFGSELPILAVLEYGYLGVDFFFVLSGFIIYHSTAGRGRSLKDYFTARLRRVYVPYLPVGLAIAVLYTLLPTMSSGARTWAWLPTLTLLPVSESPALSVAWTLQHEMLFYFLFALLYFGRVLWPGLIIWTLAIVMGPNETIPLRLINLEFVFGIIAAWAYQRGLGHNVMWLAAGALIALWISLGADRESSYLFGGACALVVLELARAERTRSAAPAWTIFLGAASYAVYLVHGLAISVVARIVPDEPTLILLACAVAGTLAGVVYYLSIERPLIHRLGGISQHKIRTGKVPISVG